MDRASGQIIVLYHNIIGGEAKASPSRKEQEMKKYKVRKGSLLHFAVRTIEAMLVLIVLMTIGITECPVCHHILCVC